LLLAAAPLALGCKTEEKGQFECSNVCAHVVEVTTRDCTINCGDGRATIRAGCMNGDCPSWTPAQADCIMTAQDVAAIGMCAYRR